MPKKEGKIDFDGRIVPNILDFNVKIDDQLTSKANFLFGASSLVMFFVLNKILSLDFINYPELIRSSWVVLLVGSFLSFLSSMMVVLPKLPFFSKKERIKEDIFYYKNILTHYSRKQYVDYRELP